ncbi:MAG: PBSX family phage terminase large subunit [Clostridiales bacterium]|nr:PBSX family phage terminase large subunit [Clostridiales bacterium]
MTEFYFTEKQKEFISDWKHGRLKRINILEGSVRSGKTFSSLIMWALWLATRPIDGKYLMAGRTLTTLKRNCLEPLQALLGEDNMHMSIPAKRAEIFGRSVDLEGAANALSENKIRGVTLSGAYVDELTLVPEDFFTMLLSRLSTEGAKLFGTTNPDSPRHWLKVNFLDKPGLDIYRIKFLLDDNTTLPADYIDNLKKEYTGVFYRRFILGDWVAAEGAIYPMFDLTRHVSDKLPRLRMQWIAADIGHTNPTAFLRLAAGDDGRIWVTDEYYHMADKAGAKSPKQYARDMQAFALKGPSPDSVIIDPAAEGFILQLKEDAPSLRIKRADNTVLEGIQLVSSAIDAGVLMIHPRCKHLIDEIQGYSWDPKAQQRGEDKPVKTNDHACDALRYALMAYRREINRRVMTIDHEKPLPADPLAMARL